MCGWSEKEEKETNVIIRGNKKTFRFRYNPDYFFSFPSPILSSIETDVGSKNIAKEYFRIDREKRKTLETVRIPSRVLREKLSNCSVPASQEKAAGTQARFRLQASTAGERYVIRREFITFFSYVSHFLSESKTLFFFL